MRNLKPQTYKKPNPSFKEMPIATVDEHWYRNPAITEALFNGLKQGRDLKTACESVGVTKPQYDKALRDGYQAIITPVSIRTPEQNALASFYAEAKRSVSVFEETAVGVILKAMKYGDWKAAAWLLERRLPEVYGKRELPPLVSENDQRAQAIQIQIVDSNGKDTLDRLKAIENEVREDIGKPLPETIEEKKE